MRYAVFGEKTTPVEELERACVQAGANNVRVAAAVKQVLCELSPGSVKALESKGYKVKPMQKTYVSQVETPVYSPNQAALSSGFFAVREAYSPALQGIGYTVVIMDTGIRGTHCTLVDKVVHERNFSDSGVLDDVFGHGTSVAYIAAGGRIGVGEESGMIPGAYLWNVKVMGDGGVGDAEDLIAALDYVITKLQEAKEDGLLPSDPMYPNVVNISLGTVDDGDPDNPVKLAAESAVEEGLMVFASVGNTGDIVDLPAAAGGVWGVGVVLFSPFLVWENSNHGPSEAGLVKPDMTFFGMNVLAASNEDDQAFTIKAGTSFAAPAAAGAVVLLAELLTARGELQPYTQLTPLNLDISGLTVKPQGVSAGKDNYYGWGVLHGSQVLQAQWNVFQLALPLFSIALLGQVVSGVVRRK